MRPQGKDAKQNNKVVEIIIILIIKSVTHYLPEILQGGLQVTKYDFSDVSGICNLKFDYKIRHRRYGKSPRRTK